MDVPDCPHRGTVGGSNCHCRHPQIAGKKRSRSVPKETCIGCPLISDQPRKTQDSPVRPRKSKATQKPSEPLPTVPDCAHRSDKPKHYEPCGCGGTVKVPVYACELLGLCTTSDRKFKDADNQRAVKRCRGCESQSSSNRFD